MEEKRFQKERIREELIRLELMRKRILRPGFLELGLTLGQGQPRILNYLHSKEPLKQKELADLCGLDVTTMSRTLDRMAEAGLIERRADPNCRRSFRIFLTPLGREKAERIAEDFRACDRRFCRGFSDGELETLLGLMKRLEENLNGPAEEGKG